jgi:hypothetical protein
MGTIEEITYDCHHLTYVLTSYTVVWIVFIFMGGGDPWQYFQNGGNIDREICLEWLTGNTTYLRINVVDSTVSHTDNSIL